MTLKQIQLTYAQKSGFVSAFCDQIRHIKTLPYLSVVQAVEGSYGIQLGSGDPHNTGPGGFFLAPPDVRQTILHHTDPATGSMTCRWVFLSVKINDRYEFTDLYTMPLLLSAPHRQQMHTLFDRLFAADNVFDETVCYYEIVRLLARVSQPKQAPASPYLEPVLSFLKQHYQQKLTVRDIAQKANISEAYLYAIFQKELHLSPITYLNNYRLSLAADALLKTDRPIAEIAAMVGIPDSVYFNKLFRRAYQMPPSQYRETYRLKSPL